ncbi:MAG: cytochrome b/b6 domain-containing protein [Gammaproteobacteria bacterium]|nr:cytochrome b/b6 domain-containing protein [Gammaproteobacteria bacterium]
MSSSNDQVLVWDWPVRVMHWCLVLSVFGAWLTHELEGDWFAWHVRFGYAVLVVTVVRLVWGFVGTRHARFVAFVRGPRAVLGDLRTLWKRDAEGSVGHTPAGAWMILALLGMLLAQGVTGLFSNDQVYQTGPLFGYVTGQMSDRVTTLHKQIFDVLWGAILIHVLAAIFYLIIKRRNLIAPMFSGRKSRKDVPEGEEIQASRGFIAIVIAAVVIAVLVLLVQTAPEAFLFGF